ncbi:MAG: Ig-like domain-containing protein, partial [Oscillospiraceae bacterium]
KTSNGGKTAKCNIIVLPDSYDEIMPDEIITESELTLAINDRYELEAEIYPNDTADKEITWTVISSSSNGVIDFSTSENSAKIIALKKGKATLRAMSKYYGYIYCDCVITVE